MIVAKNINSISGVIDSSIVMGTAENKSILKMANMLLPEFTTSNDNDLLLVVQAESDNVCDHVIANIDQMLADLRKSDDNSESFSPKSFDGALKALPEANLSLISVAGKYAYAEAMKALEKGLHVMLFSDNVSIEEEIQLKEFAKSKGLLVMGPDCGTAIINGAPLAFANVVRRGNIGVVAASGTGLQEVTTLIHNYGQGISQAIGTGGRDVKEKVGGIMFIESLKALADDPNSSVLLLVSKPPHPSVLEKIGQVVKEINKPVISAFLGANPEDVKKYGIDAYATLQEASLACVKALNPNSTHDHNEQIDWKSEASKMAPSQKYLRALYSGGTFCSETQIILSANVQNMFSNAPTNGVSQLDDIWKSQQNTVIDLGEDEFTVGKAHPMIDYSTRNKRIIDEATDPETAFLIIDIVLGYGSNMTPAEEIIPEIKKAQEIAQSGKRHLPILVNVTGTDLDPQNRQSLIKQLKESHVHVFESNAELAQNALTLMNTIGV